MNQVLASLAQAPSIRPVLEAIRTHKKFTMASIAALLIYGMSAGLAFLTQLVIARLAGAEAFGEYAYVAAWIALLASVTTLGFQTALLRLLPAYMANAQWAEARGAARFARIATFAASVVVAGAGAFLISTFVSPSRPTLALAFFIGFIALPFVAQQFIGASIARAFGGVALAMAPDRLVRDFVILTTVSAIALSGTFSLSSAHIAGALLLSAFTTCALSQTAALRLAPPEYSAAVPRYCKREWIGLAAPLILLTLSDNLLSRAGVLVLGITGRHVEAGVFAVAVSFAQLAAMPRMAVAIMFAPTASSLYARGDKDALQTLLRRAAWLSLIGTLCIAAPLLMLLPVLLPKFGAAFSEGVSISLILVAAQLFSASCGPQQHLLTMTGHERDGARLLTLAACSCVVLSLIAVHLIGAIGVALAMAASLVGWNFAMARFLRKKLQLSPGLKRF